MKLLTVRLGEISARGRQGPSVDIAISHSQQYGIISL
jgi:hypothetical protein